MHQLKIFDTLPIFCSQDGKPSSHLTPISISDYIFMRDLHFIDFPNHFCKDVRITDYSMFHAFRYLPCSHLNVSNLSMFW